MFYFNWIFILFLDANIEDHNEDELHEVELHISDLDDEMEEMLNDDDLIL